MSDAVPVIVVICDSPLLAPVLLALCAKAGGAGRLVEDATAALHHFQEQGSPQLLLVELLLGPESGFAAVRKLRKECACPIVILSGTERVSDEGWARTTGANAVLRYPLTAQSLVKFLPATVATAEPGS